MNLGVGYFRIKLQVPPHATIGDRYNSVFNGTTVTRGRAQAVIVHTGMQTEFGQIAKGLIEEVTEETPLQRRLAVLGKWIGIASLTICAIIFAIGVILGQEVIHMFIVAVGLAVAAVPEGLPAVVTLVLTLGVQRMSQKNALIRRLPSVEILGSTTVICSIIKQRILPKPLHFARHCFFSDFTCMYSVFSFLPTIF